MLAASTASSGTAVRSAVGEDPTHPTAVGRSCHIVVYLSTCRCCGTARCCTARRYITCQELSTEPRCAGMPAANSSAPAERRICDNKDDMFPGVAREDHRVVLWREHVSKEAKYYPKERSFQIADTRPNVMSKRLVEGKPPMALRPGRRSPGDIGVQTRLQAQAAAWGRSSARTQGTWGRRSARDRFSLTLGQRVEPLLKSISTSGLGKSSFREVDDLPLDFSFEINDSQSFSHRNSLPQRSKDRGFSVGGAGRYSEHSWGPVLKNGRVPRTESQNFGWGVAGRSPGQPLVRPKHAMKRLRQRAAKTTCAECVYADSFYSAFGKGIFEKS